MESTVHRRFQAVAQTSEDEFTRTSGMFSTRVSQYSVSYSELAVRKRHNLLRFIISRRPEASSDHGKRLDSMRSTATSPRSSVFHRFSWRTVGLSRILNMYRTRPV